MRASWNQMSAEARICEYWYCSNLACLVTRYEALIEWKQLDTVEMS